MHVEVLKVLIDDFKRAKQDEDAAAQLQSLGADYMKLGRPREAVASYQEALQSRLDHQQGFSVTERLIKQLVTSLLQSQQYTQLASLAQKLFNLGTDQGSYQQTIGSAVRNEAQRLQESNGPDRQRDWENAAKLIDAVSHMDPPLFKTYLDDLRAISARLDQQRRAAGSAGRQPGTR